MRITVNAVIGILAVLAIGAILLAKIAAVCVSF